MNDLDMQSAEGAERFLIENGLLDEGQPTRAATLRHQRDMEREFSPAERRMIRYTLLQEQSGG